MRLPVVLTIAGSDSGGGAGIQADIKAFHSLGVHGACAITSITSQNTKGVEGRYDLPESVVISQIKAVLGDLKPAAVKTGMLANAAIVRAVAAILAEYGACNLVVDPVVFSSGGQPLLDEGGLEAMVECLFPLAAVVTPNLEEAAALLGGEVSDVRDVREAARRIREMGPACVVLKGGHLAPEAEVTDIFCDGKNIIELSLPRVRTVNDHGTGCVFSAAVAARLARGEETLAAVAGAKRDVTRALESSLSLGGGRGPVHPLPEC